MTKTHWRKILTTDYLAGADLDDGKGGHQEIVLTIAKAVREKVKDQNGNEETCLVLHWNESAKPMILNVTNSKTLAKLFKSDYIEDWAGKIVQIGTDKVRAFGEVHDALRIRPFPPKKQEPGPTCSVCGKAITPVGKASVQDIVERSTAELGQSTCVACWNQIKAEENHDETDS